MSSTPQRERTCPLVGHSGHPTCLPTANLPEEMSECQRKHWPGGPSSSPALALSIPISRGPSQKGHLKDTSAHPPVPGKDTVPDPCAHGRRLRPSNGHSGLEK